MDCTAVVWVSHRAGLIPIWRRKKCYDVRGNIFCQWCEIDLETDVGARDGLLTASTALTRASLLKSPRGALLEPHLNG